MHINTHDLHTDYLDWDRLSLSRTCHQTFAEIASRYHAMKLFPITLMAHQLCEVDMTVAFDKYFTPSQRNVIWEVEFFEGNELQGDTTVKLVHELKGVRKLVLVGGPLKMTRSVRRETGELREWIGKEDLEIELRCI